MIFAEIGSASDSATIIVSGISLISAALAGVLAVRAQRRGSEASEKVASIGAYNTLVTSLQAEATSKAERIAVLELKTERLEHEKDHLDDVVNQQADEIRILQAQLGYVRAHLGAPPEWDPRIDGMKPYGRRESDGPNLPDGHEWATDPPTTEEPTT